MRIDYFKYMSIYRAVLRNAIKLTWQFKYLWFFGIFAALVSSVGEFNLALENFPRVSDNAGFLEILKYAWFTYRFLVGTGDR